MNLDKILDERAERCRCNECMKKVLREVVRQALELAAERAETKSVPYSGRIRTLVADKQSILDVEKEIE